MDMWRELSEEEQSDFRKWARDNHKPGDEVNPTWHPVCRDECAKIDAEVA